jgi:DNA-binding transcriptional regulator GbsR (MarR family)
MAASPSEIAEILGASVEDVDYHVKVLKEAGIVELLTTEPGKRAPRHLYRAVEQFVSDQEQTAARSADNQLDFARWVSEYSFAEVSLAIQEESFCSRSDHCVVRIPDTVDEEGWRELAEIHSDLAQKVLAVRERVADRVAAGGSATIRSRSVSLLFEMPQAPKKAIRD